MKFRKIRILVQKDLNNLTNYLEIEKLSTISKKMETKTSYYDSKIHEHFIL